MKKILTVFIMIMTICILTGCNNSDANKKIENNSEEMINQVNEPIYKDMTTLTYVSGDTYDYENVVTHDNMFSINEYAKANSLNNEDDYVVIDNYQDWENLYFDITGLDFDPPTEDNEKHEFENSVRLVFVREARSSNCLKVVYQLDTANNKLIKTYPFENEPGDLAIFKCLDIVKISKENFTTMGGGISIDAIPFEKIFDQELKKFYGGFNILINDVNGFPAIPITDDVHTSQMFNEIHKKYNEEYFKTYSIGIVSIHNSSNDKNIVVNKIAFKNNKLIVSYAFNNENYVDEVFIFQIKKEDIKGLILSSYIIETSYMFQLKKEVYSLEEVFGFPPSKINSGTWKHVPLKAIWDLSQENIVSIINSLEGMTYKEILHEVSYGLDCNPASCTLYYVALQGVCVHTVLVKQTTDQHIIIVSGDKVFISSDPLI